MLFQNRLRFVRENSDTSQLKIAEFLGISNSRYCHYENEKEAIPIKYLNKYSNYFHVSIDYLFGFSIIIKYENYKENDDIDLILSGNRLRELRKNTGLTQVKFCKKLNISNKMISKYEKGQYPISTETLYKICKKYEISADYLLGKI